MLPNNANCNFTYGLTNAISKIICLFYLIKLTNFQLHIVNNLIIQSNFIYYCFFYYYKIKFFFNYF